MKIIVKMQQILTTDASGYAIGGILSQGKIGQDKPIAYTSRTLSDSKRKFDTYEKEALAIVYSVQHFRPYLYGRRFTLVTHHKPLVWFQNSKDPCSRVTRWRFKLAEYDFDVVYKAEKTNVNADALSRNPVENIKENKNKTITTESKNNNDSKYFIKENDDKNSDGEPEPPVATNASKFEEQQSSNQNSSSDDETENLVISYILSELKQKQNTKLESKINAILTRN